ncbi:proton-coupled amino acid transporter-like protein CG1139 [Anopheles moucheti]|uniref:proton-coupled amino acid transporter-like protein CG1139 n=1 Tax=Anopheles moucheti TaxID=186751 RepID=UPI0022F0B5E8|nr:proton-coupled amino acid transporter-like protein CG1139 [Anopheles moucheti]
MCHISYQHYEPLSNNHNRRDSLSNSVRDISCLLQPTEARRMNEQAPSDIKAEHELCKRKRVPSLNYPAVTQTALLEGPEALKPLCCNATHRVNVFLLIYQLGTCCVYVVFVSSNIKAIADYYTDTDVRLYMLIILLPLILINWVRNLKSLAPFSTVANFVTLVSFGIILYYIFREPISFENRDKVGTMSGFALFFGTVLFALEAIGVILPLENEMKTPKKFGGSFGVLNKAMILIVTLYIGMGFFGYLNYGSAIKGSITLNLPEEKCKHLAQCVKGMLAFAIYITHGLACYVAIDITWNDYLKKNLGDSPRSTFFEYIARTVLVLITFLLAVAIPNLDLFISLFGALCLSALGIAFPALIQTCTYGHHRQGMAKVWMVAKNSVIGVVAMLGLVIGTSTSMIEIIHTLGHDD